MVVLEQIRKRYSRRGPWVLDGVDLTLARGSVTVVVGDNGEGKSTLLRIAAGVSEPTSGRIAGAPRSAAYIPDRPPSSIRMSTAQYLGHVGRMRGLPTVAGRARTHQLAERLQLVPGPTAPVSSLSKGNAQKVAIMQAFLVPVELLVVDEPAAGLDAAAAAGLAELVEEAATSGTAVLMSAHRPLDLLNPTLRLSGGRLGSDRRRGLRIVLQERASGAITAGFDHLATDVVRAHGRVVLRTEDPDQLLILALAQGWSLIEAAP